MFSKHAKTRNQQRCIPPIVHQWLDEYGKEVYDKHRGAIKVFFSSESIKRLERNCGRHFIRENKKYLRAYRIEGSSDSKIITCGWRTKRIKN